MRTRRWALLSVTVLGALLLGACSAAGESSASGADRSEADPAALRDASAAETQDPPADDAATCTAFGDVLTILENADRGLADGRMAEPERDGWYLLATRVLDRLPSGGDSAVQVAVAEMQQAAPAVPPGAFTEPVGVRSPAWLQAEADLGAACDELGAPLAISMFTGG